MPSLAMNAMRIGCPTGQRKDSKGRETQRTVSQIWATVWPGHIPDLTDRKAKIRISCARGIVVYRIASVTPNCVRALGTVR